MGPPAESPPRQAPSPGAGVPPAGATISNTLHALFALRPGRWRWSVGAQAALAMGLPLAVFTIAGQQQLGIVASLGGLAALYCAALRRIDRLRALPPVVVGMVVASAAGVLCSGELWLTITCLTVVAAVASAITFGIGLGPPGPIMFVNVAAISAHLAAPAKNDGAAMNGASVVAMVAIGAVLAYLVVVAPLVLPSVRRREGLGIALRALFQPFELESATIAVAMRVVIAVAVGGLLSGPAGAHRSYWVIIAAVAVLQTGNSRRLTAMRAIQRVLGTIGGVFLFAALDATAPSGAWLVVVIMLLQFATEVVVTRNYALALVFITPLALVIATSGHADSPITSVHGRIADTLLGATIALAVFWGHGWFQARRAGRAHGGAGRWPSEPP